MNPRALLLLPLLLLASACGGGRCLTCETATAPLAYEDPSSEGWRLVKDPSSTADRLVLALVGPKDLPSRGVSLTLLVDGALAAFDTFTDGSPLVTTGVYTTTPADRPGEERGLQLVVGAITGNKLSVGIFQKDLAVPAQESGRPLLRIALIPAPRAARGTPVALLLRKASYVPADLVASHYRPVPMDVALGRLATK
jgi:hypothetical protein